MDIFTKNRILIRIVIVLIILNCGLLGILIWREIAQPGPKEKPRHNDVTEILRSELQLSNGQVKEFERIREEFFSKEKVLEGKIRDARDSINVEMFNKEINDELVIKLAHGISENEFNMEMLRLEQAKQLKKICSPKQMEKFESLVLEIRDYFQPEPPQKKK